MRERRRKLIVSPTLTTGRDPMSYASFAPCPHCHVPLSYLESVSGSRMDPECPRCHKVVTVSRATFLMVDNSRAAAPAPKDPNRR
jgi:hypothetical protein